MNRFFSAHALACAFGTPIIFLGGTIALDGGKYWLVEDEAGLAFFAALLVMVVLYVGIVIVGLIPTGLAHFAARGANMNDMFGYAAAGAATWTLVGLLVTMLTISTREGLNQLLAFAPFCMIAGAVMLGIFWSRYAAFEGDGGSSGGSAVPPHTPSRSPFF